MSDPKASNLDLVPHNRLQANESDVQAVADAVRSGYWAAGPQVSALESDLEELTKRPAVVVGSGLAAIRLALAGLHIRPGDEVIIPAYSCVALANAVLAIGGVPVPADIDERRLTIAPQNVAECITDKTRAIIAVHTFGMIADIDPLRTFGFPVFEDCAHALGRGSLADQGDVSICSFYATKLIGGGEGGAILSRDKHLMEHARSFRDYTDQGPMAERLNDKMTDLAAALVRSRLQRLRDDLITRDRLAEIYDAAFSELQNRGVLKLPDWTQNDVRYRYAVFVLSDPATLWIQELQERGVSAAQPVWNWHQGQDGDAAPVSKQAFRFVLSLPLYPSLQETEQDRVIEAMHDIAGARR